MLTRAQVLERFGLPDQAFELKPVRDETNMLRIRVSHKGNAITDMSIGSASRLAAEVGSIDPDLAAQIQACLAGA